MAKDYRRVAFPVMLAVTPYAVQTEKVTLINWLLSFLTWQTARMDTTAVWSAKF
jgi:hypothetical protein